MLRTVLFFGGGGLFCAVYTNAVRRMPYFYSKVAFAREKSYKYVSEPLSVLTTTAVGTALGYWVHRYEENLDAVLEQRLREHPRSHPLRSIEYK